MNRQDETIFALATPAGRAAIQIIRVSGTGAARALRRLTGHLPEPRLMRYSTISDLNGMVIDYGMAVWFPSPASPTGDDYAEFHLHGTPQIGRMVMLTLEALPAFRLADPGEFTRRAFLNGKMTLDQTEALSDIIDADTEAQHRQAMARLDAPLSQLTETWRRELVALMARLETLIDFADEDIPDDLTDDIRHRLDHLINGIAVTLKDADRGVIIRDGVNIVLIGRPNAGKSTLLNALAGRDDAIVSTEEGTTRDIIKVSLNIDGYAVHLKDTAGLRQSESLAEKEGIKRSLKAAAEADIILLCIDGQDVENKSDFGSHWVSLHAELGLDKVASRPVIIPILTKMDMVSDIKLDKDWPSISAETGFGMDALRMVIRSAMDQLLGSGEAAMVSRQRHRLALLSCQASLISAKDVNPVTLPELLAEDLRHAAQALGRISGQVDVEDLLDEIFSSFCIGK
ncbi:MAG: tRNA uridine-5-carboxymethylaminomethyl(34) synthesis GTPase MnmE [Alphaproteobacteria bacterium]|nr:tRNA uridine-5-carboxymethylaminomethyl(34) synthesis GTPase MnmE [Alphaproteobacteria bacterium]MBL6781470.1 tRNA uridine-5-carboxymethylaminomethyl(34) synthesis GTPase MnmE [Alphaproteobacteria bacterium]